MIQNISSNRENKAITKKDIQYILRLAYLSIYQGTNQNFVNLHSPCLQLVCVKGLDNGNVSGIWYCYFVGPYWVSTSTEPYNSGEFLSPVHFLTNVCLSKFCPSLTIKPGETKIIVLAKVRHGVTTSVNLSGKELFNFHLLSPEYIYDLSAKFFFPSVVIFTPRPGLFSETPPA